MFRQLRKLRNDFEDKIADILEKIDNSSKIDEVEIKLIKQGMKSIAGMYGGGAIPDQAYETIARGINKCLGKINKKLQTQLRK